MTCSALQLHEHGYSYHATTYMQSCVKIK